MLLMLQPSLAKRLNRCECGRTKYKVANRCGSCAAKQRNTERRERHLNDWREWLDRRSNGSEAAG